MSLLEGIALLMSIWCSSANVMITISEITKLKRSTGAVGGHLIALEEINNNPNLLLNYTLNLRVNDSGGEIQTAILETLAVTTLQSDDTHISFPLILGNRLSSVSTAVNPILGAFNKGQISAGATAISLSDTDRYPYFYRTIPSDALQAEGLILLCRKFNWNRIAIVYATDVYGTGLSLKLQEVAKEYGIDATSIAVSYEGDSSYTNAARQIKELGVYIIILIVHHESHVFDYFRDESVTGYPYYFLGVDAWLSINTLKRWDNIDIDNEFKGFIGTVPWQTNGLDLSFYNEEIRNVLSESKEKYDHILDSWSKYYTDGHRWFQTELPGTKCVYGYDAMYVIAYLIEELGDDLVNYIVNGADDLLIEAINDIIIQTISFVGATGNVSFDENGDRENGFYSFGNVGNNDTIQYFGHFYRNNDGSIGYKIDESMIIWPDSFVKKNIIPSSETKISQQLQAIDVHVSITMISLLAFSCIIALGCIVLLVYYQKNPIIKVAAWRMNVIMCFGATIGYFGAILCGIDEEFIETLDIYSRIETLDILCNSRIWIIMIAFTLLFIPLFAKTCRLSVLFNAALRRSKTIKFGDKKLFMIVFICVIIDILLLIIFTLIQPLKRAYFDGEIEIIDELQNIQYIYGRCSVDDELYAFLFIFKLFELIWGLYFAFDLSRIRDHTKTLWKFDETGIQLLSILLIFIVICITIPLYTFSPINNPDLHFLIIAITSFLTGNIVISLNLFPRLFAVITKNEEKYMFSPITKIEMQLTSHTKSDNDKDI